VLTGAELDRVFLRARFSAPEPSDALMARVMQAGIALMPAPSGASPENVAPAGVAGPGPFARLWSSLSAGFGGSGVVASLGAVAGIALFLGYSDPDGFSDGFWTSSGTEAGGMTLAEADDGLELEPVAIYFLAGG